VVYPGRDEAVAEAVERVDLVDWVIEHHREIGYELLLVGWQTAEGPSS
jgi:peptide subunit release factor 1 (eRF1)